MWLKIANLFFLLSMSVLMRRDHSANEACLYTDLQYSGSVGVTRVPGGAYSKIAFSTELPVSNITGALSPDGKKLASLIYAGNSRPSSVKVQTFSPPNIYGNPLLYETSSTSDEQTTQASWSPDSQLIAYLWQIGNQHYLGLSDANGKLIKSKTFSLDQDTEVDFNGWSADGKYLALGKAPWPGYGSNHFPITLSFVSVPDLVFLDDETPGLFSDLSCQAGSGGPERCAIWSATGHQVAYVTAIGNRTQVTMTSLGTAEKHTFDVSFLPQSDHRGVYLEWSPNGRYVAAVTLSDLGTEYPVVKMDANLNVLGMDNSLQKNIDSVMMQDIDMADFGYEPSLGSRVEWTMNSTSVVYVRDQATDNQATIHIYNVMTKTNKILYETQLYRELRIYPSPDNVSIAVNRNVPKGSYRGAYDGTYQAANGLLIAQDGSWAQPLPQAGHYSFFAWASARPILAIIEGGGENTYFWFYRSDGTLVLNQVQSASKDSRDVFSDIASWGSCKQPYIAQYGAY